MKTKILSAVLPFFAASLLFVPGATAGLFDKVLDTGVTMVKAQKSTGLDDEVEMGRNFSAMVLGAYPVAGSEALNQYVTKVGMTVAAYSERPDLGYHFQVIDARDPEGNEIVNAFSTPGGFVFVTKGLLRRVKTESELAGVLGHEVAHAAQKHILKAIRNKQMTGALTQLGAEVAAEHTSGVAREFAAVIGPALIDNIFDKGLDRGDEYKADEAAALYASKAGYDPRGIIGLLKTIQAREGKGNYSTIFRTHPKPEDRIGRVERLIASRKLDQGKKQVLADRWKVSGRI